ncbi:transcriptional regulator, TetR family [Loktanella fryxellensis]|uniref:HTH-type transcriptional regulator BetI n=1 Tax=Loktanella fryxellensis TaxID=245187 RepID=A0A1H8AGJ0_9RHOB|nr:transcriptional regulator BetI [Loktanella fryxellensis]SEM68919.1 transcriptional regulator, TetR family [Loktanella fryxellensis]
MPRLGMEPIRRAALVKATIVEVGQAASLDVTVGRIAARAGVSSALAHHYFGGKDQILNAAMRQILRDYRVTVVAALSGATDRAAAIVTASFAPTFFDPDTVSAWMTFYVQAQGNPQASHLLGIYQRRLRSNLTHALRGQLADPAAAADLLAALIDGLYIRQALAAPDTDASAIALKLLGTLRAAG